VEIRTASIRRRDTIDHSIAYNCFWRTDSTRHCYVERVLRLLLPVPSHLHFELDSVLFTSPPPTWKFWKSAPQLAVCDGELHVRRIHACIPTVRIVILGRSRRVQTEITSRVLGVGMLRPHTNNSRICTEVKSTNHDDAAASLHNADLCDAWRRVAQHMCRCLPSNVEPQWDADTYPGWDGDRHCSVRNRG
jgi:hypothetical protein